MTTGNEIHAKTGDKSNVSGRYRFERYLDGTNYPAPHAQEQEISVAKDETFPPILSSGKSCFWKLSPNS